MKLSRKPPTNFYLISTVLISSLVTISDKFLTANELDCADGFYSRYHPSYNWLLTNSNSCLPCNCNQLGSLSTTCNKRSGACYCANGYVGFKCNKCASGYIEIEDGKSSKGNSTRCEICGECYNNCSVQLEELKSIGISLIRKVSDATKSRLVTLDLSDGKVIHFLNSSRFEIIESLQQEPIDLDGLIQQLDDTFLETKEYSDRVYQMTNDFLNTRIDFSVEDTPFGQTESLISSLNLMEDIVDGHIYSLNISNTLFERLKQNNDKEYIIKLASERSCKVASVVANLKENLMGTLSVEDRRLIKSSLNLTEDVKMENYNTNTNINHTSINEISPNEQEVTEDGQLRLQKNIEELTMHTSVNEDLSKKIEQVLVQIKNGSIGISQEFRKRMLKVFHESELIREELLKYLDAGRELRQVFAENAQTLSRQHENLISLHKQMDETLLSLRYSQFRCDKFM